MTAPFPEAVLAPILYFFLGVLTLAALLSAYYFRKLYLDDSEDLRVDQIGLSHREERVLEQVIEEPELQSDLPDTLDVSKATVSQAISELEEKRLVKKKKKASTYLIEPREGEIKERQ